MTRNSDLLGDSAEFHDVRILVKAGIVWIRVDDHDGFALADKEALEELGEFGVAEGHDAHASLHGSRLSALGGSGEANLILAERLETLAETHQALVDVAGLLEAVAAGETGVGNTFAACEVDNAETRGGESVEIVVRERGDASVMADDFDCEDAVTSRAGSIGHGAKNGAVLLASMQQIASLLSRADFDLAKTSDVFAAVLVVVLETKWLAVQGDAGACGNRARSSIGEIGKTPIRATHGFGAAEGGARGDVEKVKELFVIDLDVADENTVAEVAVHGHLCRVMLHGLGRLCSARRSLGKNPAGDAGDHEWIHAKIGGGFGLRGLLVDALDARYTEGVDGCATLETLDAVEDDIERARENARASWGAVAHDGVTFAGIRDAVGEHETALTLKQRFD